MPHPTEHDTPARTLAAGEAEELAETLKALASPARLRLLVELLDGARTVEQLAAAADLGASATSHHLRILRALRLVRAHRAGRDRKSTRLNSSHRCISYAVFCLKKKK